MKRLDALKELAEKVEAGDWGIEASRAARTARPGMNDTMWDAYCGDLDAAKALHEAVLPGWVYFLFGADYETCIGGEVHPPRAIVSKGRAAVNLVTHSGENNIPARAWLLAILRALIAQEEAHETD